jgi:hypothetical protein
MKVFSAFVLTIALLPAISGGQTKSGGNVVSTNECISKGSVGIVNTHLYIALTSDKNELILDGGKRWVDQLRDKREVVIFFENRVLAKDDVLPGFNLSKAIIVSFEGNIVRFFDFNEMSGGYYRRPKE